MVHKHAKIQILDVPGIVKGAASGRGRGREVLASMRSADVCLILLDATRPKEYDVIVKEIYDSSGDLAINLKEDLPKELMFVMEEKENYE